MYRFKEWPLKREEFDFNTKDPILRELFDKMGFRFGYVLPPKMGGAGRMDGKIDVYFEYSYPTEKGEFQTGAKYTVNNLEEVQEVYKEETYKAYYILEFVKNFKEYLK